MKIYECVSNGNCAGSSHAIYIFIAFDDLNNLVVNFEKRKRWECDVFTTQFELWDLVNEILPSKTEGQCVPCELWGNQL